MRQAIALWDSIPCVDEDIDTIRLRRWEFAARSLRMAHMSPVGLPFVWVIMKARANGSQSRCVKGIGGCEVLWPRRPGRQHAGRAPIFPLYTADLPPAEVPTSHR